MDAGAGSGGAADVVGAGAIGVAVGWSLLRAGWDVTFVEPDPGKRAFAASHGVEVVGHGALPARVLAPEEWEPSRERWTVLCTKTYDNAAVLGRLRGTDRLLPIQNGYEHGLEALAHPFEGIASFVSECGRDTTRARITRKGRLHLGPRRDVAGGSAAELRLLAEGLRRGVAAVSLVPDVRPYKATKLLYNAAVSPLAAAAGTDNAVLLEDPAVRRLFFALLRENYRVLRGAGVTLARIGPFPPSVVDGILARPLLAHAMAVFFRRGLRGTYSSMAADVGRGRTELDAYNGWLVALAGERTPCPVNRAVCDMVRAVAAGRRTPSRAILHDLLARVGPQIDA